MRHEPGMSVYISGPMTGLPNCNFDTFNEWAAQLRAEGWTVLNPAENFGGSQDRERYEYMRLDLAHVLEADIVAVLPGWMDSRGARLEVAVAQEINTPVVDIEDFEELDDFRTMIFVVGEVTP